MAKHMRVWLRMSYRCCGMEWDEEWPEAFRLECPDCGVLIEPCSIVEIAPQHASKTQAEAPAPKARMSARSSLD